MQLPPPAVKVGPAEQLLGFVSAHAGLLAALGLGALIASALARMRKLPESKTATLAGGAL